MIHQSVLLQEVIDYTSPQTGEIVVDGTLGFAGHAQALCQNLGQAGLLVGIDQDSKALSDSAETLKACPCQIKTVLGNFRHLAKILDQEGIEGVDVVLLDLGMSSFHIDSSGRGFSFLRVEPLLMTMAEIDSETLTAKEIVNEWAESDIANVIFAYGGEHFAKRIAHNIVKGRAESPIETTTDLVAIVEKSVPVWYRHRKTHPATKTFQALRIAVNDELEALTEGLVGAWQKLNQGGRLAVISFHGLEAKIIKDFFNEQKKLGRGEILTKHAVKPTREEVLKNPRARSAQLRVIKKI